MAQNTIKFRRTSRNAAPAWKSSVSRDAVLLERYIRLVLLENNEHPWPPITRVCNWSRGRLERALDVLIDAEVISFKIMFRVVVDRLLMYPADVWEDHMRDG